MLCLGEALLLDEGLLCLGEPEAFDIQDAPFRLGEGSFFALVKAFFTLANPRPLIFRMLTLHLGKLLRLGEVVPPV